MTAPTKRLKGMQGFDRSYIERIDSLVEVVEDWSKLSEEPVVSIWTITFNQGAYIRQAIDGILMQQTTFAYEVVVGDDCSTDETRSILLDYQQRHPDRVRLRLAKENLHSQKLKQSIGVFAACRGRYIALCEGDDYWTDPLKLEKQVALLESSPDLSGCFHRAYFLEQESGKMSAQKLRIADRFTLDDLLGGNFIYTASMMIRAGLVDPFPQFFYTVPFGDWSLFVLQAEQGDIGFIDEIMSVYRRHGGGILTGAGVQFKATMNAKAFDALGSYFGNEKEAILTRGFARSLILIATVAANEGNWALAREYYRQSQAEASAWRNGSFMRTALLWMRLYLPFFNRAAVRLRAMR